MAARIFAGSIFVAGAVLLGAVFFGVGGSEETIETASDSTAAVGDAPVVVPDADVALDEQPTPTTAAPIELENLGQRLDLVNLDGWLNTEISELDELDGKVVVLEMWTFGCFNCQNRIPHTQELYARTSRDDLEIVGVHAPEFDFEREIPAIVDATERFGVTWPVAIDTEKENFRAWQEGGRRFWPRTYVIDQNGDVRFNHIGEGAYDELDDVVDFLIANPPDPADAATTSLIETNS